MDEDRDQKRPVFYFNIGGGRIQPEPEIFYLPQEEIDQMRNMVAKRFSIYDVKPGPDMVAFYIHHYDSDMEGDFEALRLEMRDEGYIPMLRQEMGEYLVIVARKPQRQFRGTKVNLIFLIATILSTAFAGMMLWASYMDLDSMFTVEALVKGLLYFALPLLAILAVHEMGHYTMARKHNVAASLPFFIPFPGSPLGTMGAVISIREPIPNRKALLDIGFAGPIAGFVVALPVAFLGLYLTNQYARPVPLNSGDMGPGMTIYLPLVYQFLIMAIPLKEDVLIHPTAFAGWAGLFVTAFNLLPASQLDGGHISHAILGRGSRIVSYGTAAVLLFLAIIYSYWGWIILVFLIMIFGLRHPPTLNSVSVLDGKRRLIGLAAVIMLVLCFVPVPVGTVQPVHDFAYADGANEITELSLNGSQGSQASAVFWIENTGNSFDVIRLTINLSGLSDNWSANLAHAGNLANETSNLTLELNGTESAEVQMMVFVPSGTQPGEYSFPLQGHLEKSTGEWKLKGKEKDLLVVLTVL